MAYETSVQQQENRQLCHGETVCCTQQSKECGIESRETATAKLHNVLHSGEMNL